MEYLQVRTCAFLRTASTRRGRGGYEPPAELMGLRLDGYAAGSPAVLVEIFAHVGASKAGQRRKIVNDMAKLVLAERLLDVPCRKLIAVIDHAAIAHFEGSWAGEFARHFDIERLVVPGMEHRRDAMRAVQERQRR